MTDLRNPIDTHRAHRSVATNMIQSNRNSHEEIACRIADTQGVQMALKTAASKTVREHAMSGHKIVVWRDNQVVWEEVSLASIPDRPTEPS